MNKSRILYSIALIFSLVAIGTAWTYTTPPNSIIDASGFRFGNVSITSTTIDGSNLTNVSTPFCSGASYCIYNQSGTIIAVNGTTQNVDYSGADAIVLQDSINQTNLNGGGVVFLKTAVILTSSNLKTLLIRENVILQGEGIDASIIRAGIDIQQNVIEMDNNSELRDLTVDGNYLNNLAGEGTWAVHIDVPIAQNIMMAKRYWNGGSLLSTSNNKIQNVKSIRALRSNLVVNGQNSSVDTVYLYDSYTDHPLYVTNTANSTIRNVWTAGMARSEVIAVGTDANTQTWDTIIDTVHISPPTCAKFLCPVFALQSRPASGGRNTYKNFFINDNGSSDGSNALQFRINNPYETVDGITYTSSIRENALYINSNNASISNIKYSITTGQSNLTQDRYMLYITGNNVQVSNAFFSVKGVQKGSTWMRGIRLEDANNVTLNNVILDVPGQATSALNSVYHTSNVLLLNNSLVSGVSGFRYGSIYPISPWTHGNNATAPTAFGAGDTYFNSTANKPCYSNASGIANWNTYADVAGC